MHALRTEAGEIRQALSAPDSSEMTCRPTLAAPALMREPSQAAAAVERLGKLGRLVLESKLSNANA